MAVASINHNETDEAPEATKGLQVDVLITADGRRYRVTHLPSRIFAESESVTEAHDLVNAILAGE